MKLCNKGTLNQCYSKLRAVWIKVYNFYILDPHECRIEDTNEYHNLLHNITVLHARDNHLPEAHQSLQKILN